MGPQGRTVEGTKYSLIAGFMVGGIAGGILGLAWGRATRERVPGATSTSYSDGVVTVEFDAAQAALGSMRQYFQQ